MDLVMPLGVPYAGMYSVAQSDMSNTPLLSYQLSNSTAHEHWRLVASYSDTRQEI